jgi:hypothetical protein
MAQLRLQEFEKAGKRRTFVSLGLSAYNCKIGSRARDVSMQLAGTTRRLAGGARSRILASELRTRVVIDITTQAVLSRASGGRVWTSG